MWMPWRMSATQWLKSQVTQGWTVLVETCWTSYAPRVSVFTYPCAHMWCVSSSYAPFGVLMQNKPQCSSNSQLWTMHPSIVFSYYRDLYISLSSVNACTIKTIATLYYMSKFEKGPLYSYNGFWVSGTGTKHSWRLCCTLLHIDLLLFLEYTLA